MRKRLPKKQTIKTINEKVDEIYMLLEKIKKISKDNKKDQLRYISFLEEEILNDITEINNILMTIHASLDDLK